MSTVVANQPGWHWLGSIHAHGGTNGTNGQGQGSKGQTATHSTSSSSHGTSTHASTQNDLGQNGSLGQHVNTTA